MVRVDNELWSAVSDLEIREGSRVVVVERQGLYVKVKPISEGNSAADEA
ncbi:NfeD family protein [Acidilobus sp.]